MPPSLFFCIVEAVEVGKREKESRKNFGDIAQLAEHRLCKPGVTGSNPVISI